MSVTLRNLAKKFKYNRKLYVNLNYFTLLLLTQLTCSLTSLNPIPTHFRKVDLGKAILKQALTTVGGGAYHENPRDKFILFASFAFTSFSYIFKNLNMVRSTVLVIFF